MEKQKLLELWLPGDDAAIAREVGVAVRTVHYWRTAGKKSKHEARILEALNSRVKNRQLVKRMVPIETQMQTL